MDSEPRLGLMWKLLIWPHNLNDRDLTLKVKCECSCSAKFKGGKKRQINMQMKKGPGGTEAPVDLTVRFLETITGNKGNSSLLDEG